VGVDVVATNESAISWKDVRDHLVVDVPEGTLDGITVERFEFKRDSTEWLVHALREGYRAAQPGIYTRLIRDGQLWMSDTTAEQRDHMDPLYEMWRYDAKRVLVNGLGLGMIVNAALALPSVEHIDVVEIDERVAKLVGQHYEKSGRVTVHVADAYEQMRRWPANTHWDVGWSDIWPHMCADDLRDMARLNRSYARRCTWHACWGQENIKAHKRQRGW
jgi:hypothetical protein